jgi:hypothetical protein
MRILNRVKEWLLEKLGIVRLTPHQREIIDQMERDYAQVRGPKNEKTILDESRRER